MKIHKVVAAVFVLSGTLLAASSAMAHSKSGDAFDGSCTMTITGFEHWGRASASVKDASGSCADMRPRVYYDDGDSWRTERWDWDDYTKVTAGPWDDWSRARGWHESASPRSWSVWR